LKRTSYFNQYPAKQEDNEMSIDGQIADLLRPMLKKLLFVALGKAVVPAEQMLPDVAEHLRYMNRLESEGFLFASGPFVQEGVLVGDGLTILRTETIEEARALMEAEPLTAGRIPPVRTPPPGNSGKERLRSR
jgi:uncharacterized protein YciI